MGRSRLTRDGTAEPVSRDQILRRKRGQGNIHFPCSADHVQDWQPYPVDPYSCYYDDHTYIERMGTTSSKLYWAYCAYSPSVGMSRLTRDVPKSSRETTFSGPNRDRKIFIFPAQLTTSRIDWQPYPVDPYSHL